MKEYFEKQTFLKLNRGFGNDVDVVPIVHVNYKKIVNDYLNDLYKRLLEEYMLNAQHNNVYQAIIIPSILLPSPALPTDKTITSLQVLFPSTAQPITFL